MREASITPRSRFKYDIYVLSHNAGGTSQELVTFFDIDLDGRAANMSDHKMIWHKKTLRLNCVGGRSSTQGSEIATAFLCGVRSLVFAELAPNDFPWRSHFGGVYEICLTHSLQDSDDSEIVSENCGTVAMR